MKFVLLLLRKSGHFGLTNSIAGNDAAAGVVVGYLANNLCELLAYCVFHHNVLLKSVFVHWIFNPASLYTFF